MKKLRRVMGRMTTYEASRRTRDKSGRILVGHLQFKRLLSGETMPWDVRVGTASAICRAFPGKIRIEDFYRKAV